MVTHITKDGLFFYGSATNGYVITAMILAAARRGCVAGGDRDHAHPIARALLDALNLCQCPPLDALSLWVIGVAGDSELVQTDDSARRIPLSAGRAFE